MHLASNTLFSQFCYHLACMQQHVKHGNTAVTWYSLCTGPGVTGHSLLQEALTVAQLGTIVTSIALLYCTIFDSVPDKTLNAQG